MGVNKTFQFNNSARQFVANMAKTFGKSTRFSILLYPDSNSYNWVCPKTLTDGFRYSLLDDVIASLPHLRHYGYVTHIADDEDLKTHVHLGLQFDENHPVSPLYLYDLLGLNSSVHIKFSSMNDYPWRNWLSQMEYYNHDDCIGKTPSFDTFVSDAPYIPKYERCSKVSSAKERESEEATYIIDYIESAPYCLSITELTRWCLANGVYSSFRRNSSIFKMILSEHNHEYDQIKRLKETAQDFNDFIKDTRQVIDNARLAAALCYQNGSTVNFVDENGNLYEQLAIKTKS